MQRGRGAAPERGARVSLHCEADDVVLIGLKPACRRVLASAAAHAAAARAASAWATCTALAIVLLGPLVVYPLVRLVLLSVSGDHGLSFAAYRTFFGNPDTRSVLLTTLGVLFASAGTASVLGVLLAALLFFAVSGRVARHAFPGTVRRVPSFLVAFTLIFLYGSQGSISIALQHLFHLENPPLDFLFGIGGVILAQTVFYTPFVVRPTLASFATLDLRLIEAARSLGASGWMLARRVVLPIAWPASLPAPCCASC